MKAKQIIQDLKEILNIPRLRIDLGRRETAENDPFFFEAVDFFYRSATRHHPKFPFIRSLQYGVAVFELPENHETYLKALEGSARRNIKKAMRKGYTFQRIEYNEYLQDIGEIHRSAQVRQGPMDEAYLKNDPTPVNNPVSRTQIHDYPYFGIVKDGKLVAYAGCLVASEMLLLSTVFGHDDYKSDGVVPLLVSGIAEYKFTHYPNAKYYVYDKYYGASRNLRRFKKKFRFEPCVVKWAF